jgi:hypothetical protein
MEATGFELIPGQCEQVSTTASHTTVRCPFDFHALRSEELGRGPYADSSITLTVEGDEIVAASMGLAFEDNGFSAQMWEPFAAWIKENHPEDIPVMFELADQSLESHSEESAALWAQRTEEWVEALEATHAGTVVVTDDECRYQPSDTPLQEGALTFTVVNETNGDVGVHVWGPLVEGHTFDDFASFVDEEIRLTNAGEPYLGPPSWFGSLIPADVDSGLVGAGATGDISGNAEAGTLGIACAKMFEELRIFAYAGPLEVGASG